MGKPITRHRPQRLAEPFDRLPPVGLMALEDAQRCRGEHFRLVLFLRFAGAIRISRF